MSQLSCCPRAAACLGRVCPPLRRSCELCHCCDGHPLQIKEGTAAPVCDTARLLEISLLEMMLRPEVRDCRDSPTDIVIAGGKTIFDVAEVSDDSPSLLGRKTNILHNCRCLDSVTVECHEGVGTAEDPQTWWESLKPCSPMCHPPATWCSSW